MSTIIPMERFNSKTLLHARKRSGCWCTRAAALRPPRRRLIHGKHQQGLAGNDPLNTALVAQADQRLRAQHAELALHHSLQVGRVGERIRRLRRRLTEEAVDGDLEVHVVMSGAHHVVSCIAVGFLSLFLASHCHHVKPGSRCHNIVGRAAEHWRCILAADILSVAVRQARLRRSRRQGV